MAFKQPSVPEYRAEEGMEAYVRTLILFLKDFCLEAWAESRRQKNTIRDMARMIERIQRESGIAQNTTGGEG